MTTRTTTTIFKTNEALADCKNINDILETANLNWTVRLEDTYLSDGTKTDMYVTRRDDTNDIIGYVGGRYEVVQNEQAFAILNELTEDVTFTEAGCFRNGASVYITCDLDTRYISDYKDNAECKLVFTTSHDGSAGINCNIIPIIDGKVLNLPINSVKRRFKTKHTKLVSSRMNQVSYILDLSKTYFEQVMKEIAMFGKVTVTSNQINMFSEVLFPTNKDMSERTYQNTLEKRELLKSLVHKNDNNEYTAYSLLSAVSSYIEKCDHKNTKNYEDNRKEETINGNKLLDNAYRQLKNLI